MVNNKLYCCCIKLHRRSYYSGDPELLIVWEGFNFEQYLKWKWYFRYRQALWQIEYPKRFVELREYQIVPDKRSAERNLKNKIRAAKSKVTEISNKIKRAEDNYNALFPIEEDPLYQKCQALLFKKKTRLKMLQEQFESLTASSIA